MSEVVETMEDFKEELEESIKKGPQDATWQELKEAMDLGKTFEVKVNEAVKGGVTTELNGLRAFIPASQLSLSYVEDLTTFVNKTVTATPITVSAAENRLVLSVKAVAAKEQKANKQKKMDSMTVGEVYEGKVESIKPYGAFIDLGDGVSGLLHVSRISNKRIATPADVLKEGQEVSVKLLEVKDGKLSLAMKDWAPAERPERSVEREERGEEHVEHIEEAISTSLGGLLSGLKL